MFSTNQNKLKLSQYDCKPNFTAPKQTKPFNSQASHSKLIKTTSHQNEKKYAKPNDDILTIQNQIELLKTKADNDQTTQGYFKIIRSS